MPGASEWLPAWPFAAVAYLLQCWICCANSHKVAGVRIQYPTTSNKCFNLLLIQTFFSVFYISSLLLRDNVLLAKWGFWWIVLDFHRQCAELSAVEAQAHLHSSAAVKWAHILVCSISLKMSISVYFYLFCFSNSSCPGLFTFQHHKKTYV